MCKGGEYKGSRAITESLAEVLAVLMPMGKQGQMDLAKLCQELKSESQRWLGASVTLNPRFLFLCQTSKSAAQKPYPMLPKEVLFSIN